MADCQWTVSQENVRKMVCGKESRSDVASRINCSRRVVDRTKGIATSRLVLCCSMLNSILKIKVGLDSVSRWSQRAVIEVVFVEGMRGKGGRDGVGRSG